MSESRDRDRGRNGTPANKMVDLREAARKGVVTVDLGDVAPTRPTNLNPFAKPSNAEPTLGSDSPGSSASGATTGE